MNTPLAGPPVPVRRRSRLVFWVLMSFAAFYLFAEHRAHLAGLGRWLPLLILLACPLLHLFGHGGHGGHRGHAGHSGHGEPEPNDAPSRDVPPAAESPTPPPAIPRTPHAHVQRGDLP
jgi:hypothetical protein